MPTLLLVIALSLGPTDSLRIAVAPGESLRVILTGGGAPVVLIPGLSGGTFGFRHLIDSLAARQWQVIAIEPLGTGGSARPRNADYSLAAQADRIAAVFDTLEIPSALVVAHSLAGSIALRLAYRHPEHVRAILSIEGGAAESAATKSLRQLMRFAPVIELLGQNFFRQAIVRQMRAASADTSWIVEGVIAGYTVDATRDLSATMSVLKAMSEATEPESLGDRLVEVGVPVVLLVGAERHASKPQPAELALLRDRLRTLWVVDVPGAGHFIHEEQLDVVLDAITRFSISVAQTP